MAEEIESTEVTEGEVVAPPPPPAMHGALLTDSRGQTVLHPDRASYLEVVSALRNDGFVMCVDLCAVDYLLDPPRDLPDGVEPGRFEIVVNLLSLVERKRLRLRVQLPGDDPRIPSIVDLHPGVETAEREAYDMFGILFTGHPDLSRILMPDDWEGHPLRKDYATGRIPVQFRDAPGAR